MKYVNFLRSLQSGDLSEFETDVEDQKKFINSLGDATDDFDRSIKQYYCQNFFIKNKNKILLFNVVSIVIMPFVLLYMLFMRTFCHFEESKGALITFKGMPEVIPVSLCERYDIHEVSFEEGMSLGCGELVFVVKFIARSIWHPYFALKTIIKLCCYSSFIKKYSPRAILTFGEFSFSSSVLTAYCHYKKIKHINVMHGEKTYFIRDSYFHFDECFVWDYHYVDLFTKLKAETHQFRIEVPPSVKIDCDRFYNEKSYADVKYYLAIYDEKELLSIISQMEILKKHGKKIAYRPHPRYSDMRLLRKYVPLDEIENTSLVSIRESISSLKYAVGSCSTVLTQAYFSGKDVILDNVTYERQYIELEKRSYILSEYRLTKLSDFVKNCDDFYK